MSFLTQVESDISLVFVGARAVVGDPRGSRLAQALRTSVSRQVRGDSSIEWTYAAMSTDVVLPGNAAARLADAAVGVLVLAEGGPIDWKASPWADLSANVADRAGTASLLLVEMGSSNLINRPPPLANVIAYTLPDASADSDRQFFDRLNDLGRDIAHELTRRKADEIEQVKAEAIRNMSPPPPTVPHTSMKFIASDKPPVRTPGRIDVFLSHDSKDKSEVERIARRLVDRGIMPWLDKWDIVAGDSVTKSIGTAMTEARTAAIFINGKSLGRWEEPETNTLIYQSISKKKPLIPVVLATAPPAPAELNMPELLRDTNYVDFRQSDPDPFERLVQAIERETKGIGPPRGKVLLAEVTDDLVDERAEVARYLVQNGWTVLPDRMQYPRDDPEAFKAAVRNDLDGCRLFVQLLNTTAGRTTDALPGGYAVAQWELAVESKKPIIQWRDRMLDVTKAKNPQHRQVLEGPAVRASDLDTFRQEVLELLNRPEPAADPSGGPEWGKMVLVNAETGDRADAEKVVDWLGANGNCVAFLPVTSQDPLAVIGNLEAQLKECQGVILFYGQASATWVQEQIRFTAKTRVKHRLPPPVLAIYEGPPPEPPKAKPGARMPRMMSEHLRGHNGPVEAELRRFLDELNR